MLGIDSDTVTVLFILWNLSPDIYYKNKSKNKNYQNEIIYLGLKIFEKHLNNLCFKYIFYFYFSSLHLW